MKKKIEIKPTNLKIDTKQYLTLLEIFQYTKKFKEKSKTDIAFKFGKNKVLAEQIWECYHILKIEWPVEIYNRIFTT